MPGLIMHVDENNNKIDLLPKSEIIKNNLWHRSVHLLLFNSKNQVLLQKRSSDKIIFPNLYTASVSGAVEDETYDQAMEREMKEEIGISVPFKKLFIYKSITDVAKSFRTVYFAQSDKKVTVDKREAQSYKWITLPELKKDINENPDKYTPPLKQMMEIYFDKFGLNLPTL